MVSRQEAKERGLKRYSTGVACPHGHVAERYVSTMQCVECIKAYAPQWMKNHPEATAEMQHEWRGRNQQRVKDWKSASQKRNRTSANTRQRRYVEANKESVSARTQSWAAANPAAGCAKSMRYHADKLKRTPAWADHDAILGMYELAQLFRNVGLEIEVDHEIPLRGKNVSGLHVHDNLQLIHATANRIKSNHF